MGDHLKRNLTYARPIPPDQRPIVVAGLPRSGSTWLAETLAVPAGVSYVHEPENTGLDPFAMVGLRGMPFPDLERGDANPSFELLWELALRGGWPPADRVTTVLKALARRPRVPRPARIALAEAAIRRAISRAVPPARVLVKTVRSHLSLPWLDERFDLRVVVVWRHPLNVLSSWTERGYPEPRFTAGNRRVQDRFRSTPAWPPPVEPFAGMAWAVCAQTALLIEDAVAHEDWVLVAHEETAAAPGDRFADLYERLDLPWTDAVTAHLDAHDRPGEQFVVMRVAREEGQRWRERLSAEEAGTAARIIADFAALSPASAARWSVSRAVQG